MTQGIGTLLAGQPVSRRIPDARERIDAACRASRTQVVVLDDDPTGTQSVQGVPVLTRWEPDDLRWAFAQPATVFFVLTNSRGLGEPAAAELVREVAEAVERVARELSTPVVLVSRSDSTLRGHFPLETDTLADVARAHGRPYDAVLLVPAYIDAGRVTVNNVHYARSGDQFVPVGKTDYAADATFGYSSSNLREWVEEKSAGRVAADDVASVTLADIRDGGPNRVRDVLLSCHGGRPVVVNAVDTADLDVFVLGLIAAEATGWRALYRTGPSFVPARAGLTTRPPLSHDELFPGGPRPGHGLVVVGSHVDLTTRQLARLRQLDALRFVELDVPALLDPDRSAEEQSRCAAELSTAGQDVVLLTSRQRIAGTSAAASLDIARKVSAALVGLTSRLVREAPPAWVVAKGGTTSSDIATDGLSVRRATVLGQLFPGIVSVWRHEGGDEDGLVGLPYVVFAGNVGDESTLADAVSLLRGAR